MSKHTPGPWKWDFRKAPAHSYLSGAGELEIMEVTPESLPGESDACLIAAAPELLEAAISALKLIRGSGFSENTEVFLKLKKAIAKAEGNEK